MTCSEPHARSSDLLGPWQNIAPNDPFAGYEDAVAATRPAGAASAIAWRL